ncbi:MAG: hypothetical protein A2289_04040 [Deltaproteobacteria bacterium RIFOXYA12_FULL_58_15]|nr:MAG: hypothetical protein A2289_04040 [Deltaproteobacteria bacterium RIFOXYA12_FULL_58_15]
MAVVTFAVVLLIVSTAAADKDRYEVGEEVKNFTLKVVNSEVAGEPYVGIDRYYGPDAKEPKKAVLLSFFATYCEPCKKEMPFLAALYDLYRDKGLMVLSISIDKEPEKVEEVATLAKDSNAKFPILSDRFNIVAKRYFISKLPCVYLIDAAGKVAMVNVGYNDDASRIMLESIRKAIGVPLADPVPESLARHMHGNVGDSAVEVPGEVGAGAAATDGSGAVGGGKSGEGDAAIVDVEDSKASKGKKKSKKKRRGRNKNM